MADISAQEVAQMVAAAGAVEPGSEPAAEPGPEPAVEPGLEPEPIPAATSEPEPAKPPDLAREWQALAAMRRQTRERAAKLEAREKAIERQRQEAELHRAVVTALQNGDVATLQGYGIDLQRLNQAALADPPPPGVAALQAEIRAMRAEWAKEREEAREAQARSQREAAWREYSSGLARAVESGFPEASTLQRRMLIREAEQLAVDYYQSEGIVLDNPQEIVEYLRKQLEASASGRGPEPTEVSAPPSRSSARGRQPPHGAAAATRASPRPHEMSYDDWLALATREVTATK